MRRLVYAAWPPVLVFGALGYLRFGSVHNQTFDLAFYARMAHGLARGDLYDPILGAHVLGLHVSPVLAPLGVLGMVFGTVPVLLLAQTLSAGLAAQGLAQLGARRLGPWGALAGLAFALHPNLSHVLSYEFHPGTLALAPLVWMLDAVDRCDPRRLVWATVAVLLCREDLAAITALTGVVAWLVWEPREARVWAAWVAGSSLLWLALWVGLIIPLYAPEGGSLDQHFGHLGGGFGTALSASFTRPAALLAHLSQTSKLSFLPRVLLPLLGLSLLAPRRLLPASPVLVMLMLSQFPTTTELRTHYLTPALPALVWAALHGLERVATRWRPAVGGLALSAAVTGYVVGGCAPLSLHFFLPYYVDDDATRAARAVLRELPADASVQAPDALLPHLAERQSLHRAAPPERHADFWVVDVSHRARYAGQGTLLRTAEEPFVRAFMAREDRGVRLYAPPYLLLERGRDPRVALAGFMDSDADAPGPDEAHAAQGRRPTEGPTALALTGCLSVTHATRSTDMEPGDVRLHFLAHGPCPTDLALRLGPGERPRRVELLFGGAASPAVLRAGDRVFSDYAAVLGPDAEATHVYVGALRSSGARPEPGDPTALTVPVLGP